MDVKGRGAEGGMSYCDAHLVEPWQSRKSNRLLRRSAPNPCTDQHLLSFGTKCGTPSMKAKALNWPSRNASVVSLGWG